MMSTSGTGSSASTSATSQGSDDASKASTNGNGAAGSVQSPGFNSKLSAPRERFLAAVVEHALLVGRRTAKDFVRAFPPRDIMNALVEQPRLRAKLLVATTGLNEKIALKKSATAAGEDLDLALAERVTEEDDVVALFDPDDRVRYLDHNRLWAFVVEGEFWRAAADAPPAVAREHIAYILERARVEKLINDRDIIDGIGLPTLIESLPKETLGKVIEKALSEGRAGRVFKDERALDVLAPLVLVEHISLAHIWLKVIAAKLAFWKAGTSTATTTSISPSAASVSSASLSAAPAPPESSPALDAKTETKDAKSEPKLDAKTDAKADAKTDAKADAKTENGKSDAKAEAIKAETKSEPKVDSTKDKDKSERPVSATAYSSIFPKSTDRVPTPTESSPDVSDTKPPAPSSSSMAAASGIGGSKLSAPALPSMRMSGGASDDLPDADDVDDLLSKVGVEAAAKSGKL